MGKFWLTSLPDVLRDAGLVVDTYDGWEVRARSTGGYDGVWAVQCHHTASQTSPANDMSYMWDGSPDRPVGAIYLARDGRVTVGAAGATNTSGKGGPRVTVHGTIPQDAANKYVISVEAANNGVGEPWPQPQQDAYIKLVSALDRAYALSVGDVHAHFEWTDRKIDPAGNSKYATGGNKWDMDHFRGDVWLYDPDPDPPDPPDPIPGDDDVTTKLLYCDKGHGDPNFGIWYLCGDNTKTWISDGNALAQFGFRIAEAFGKPVDYTKPENYPVPLTQPLTPICPLDGFRYAVLSNANPDLLASYGPIIGPRPPGVDEYGR